MKEGGNPITRICITGGPCGGKSTALTELQIQLQQLGFRVLLVPDAAEVMKKGGALIKAPKEKKVSFTEAAKYPKNLMRLQMDLEDIFIAIAQTSSQHTIILYDSGVMDV